MLTARVLFILHLTKITKTSNFVFFFFNDTATTEIYTLSLHDALPICQFTSTPAAAGQDGPFGARFRRRVTKLFLQCPFGCVRARARSNARSAGPARRSRQALQADRKSVVEGKSVDLGGRRIIKKKKKRRSGGRIS